MTAFDVNAVDGCNLLAAAVERGSAVSLKTWPSSSKDSLAHDPRTAIATEAVGLRENDVSGLDPSQLENHLLPLLHPKPEWEVSCLGCTAKLP